MEKRALSVTVRLFCVEYLICRASSSVVLSVWCDVK